MTIKKLVLDRFTSWSSKSTSHGYPKIFNSDKVLVKVIWSVCFIVATTTCSYVVIQNIFNYLKYEVASRITVVHESSMEFPIITFCNRNPFTTDYAYELVKNFSIETKRWSPSDTTGAISLGALNMASSLDNERKKKLGLTINETLVAAKYNGNLLKGEDFIWSYDFSHGNCYSYHPHENITQSNFGLSMLLFKGIINMNKSLINEDNGMHLVITHPSFRTIVSEGIGLMPGTLNSIILKKTIVRNLPRPFSNCEDSLSYKSELIEFIKSSGYSFRQKDCHGLCIQKEINKNCRCNHLDYPKYCDKIPSCLSYNENVCSASVSVNFTDFLEKQCLKFCPLECENVNYEISTSSVAYPTDSYAQILRGIDHFKKIDPNREFTNQQIKESLIKVVIKFDDLRYTNIEQMPAISGIDLISSVGGTLGLFLGISLLSLCEIIELIIEILYSIIKRDVYPTK